MEFLGIFSYVNLVYKSLRSVVVSLRTRNKLKRIRDYAPNAKLIEPELRLGVSEEEYHRIPPELRERVLFYVSKEQPED